MSYIDGLIMKRIHKLYSKGLLDNYIICKDTYYHFGGKFKDTLNLSKYFGHYDYKDFDRS